MKILIVDDDKLQLEVISHQLRSNGYETVNAKNGYEALEIINKDKIDLIIADVLMPNLSGLDLLNLLKRFYFNKIPVIIISSFNKADALLQSIKLGASEFISKPIDFNKLLISIKKFAK